MRYRQASSVQVSRCDNEQNYSDDECMDYMRVEYVLLANNLITS